MQIDLSRLLRIDEFANFVQVRDIPPKDVTHEHLQVVRTLDERQELEPYIRAILYDSNETPHGPAELVDILTHKLIIDGVKGMAAFILKGRSFPTVRPKDVSHQIYRLEKIADLKIAILASPGTILDSAKEQFCSTAIRLGCQYSIFDAIDLSRLLIAYGFICPRDAKKIVSGRCTCGYSPSKRLLNLFQKDSLAALSRAHTRREPAGLIILPPGSGKTRIAAEDAFRTDAARILYLAHTAEILDVAQSEFEAVFSSQNVVRHTKPSSLTKPKRVNIASIQLVHRNRTKSNLAAFDYVIVDEFHHAAAKSYRTVLKESRPSFLLGLTATPFRGDSQSIYELCGQNVLANFELRTGIDTGILSPYHYYGCFDDINYTNIKHNGNSYDIRDLERALIIPRRHEAVIDKWREFAEGKCTIAFCRTQEHAKRACASFKKAGIASAEYVSSTTLAERRKVLQQLANGEIKILCAVDVLNEGADIPFVECLLFLRPTESKRIFYQQLGRGLRLQAGKSHCTVIDFIGNFKNAYKIVEYNSLSALERDETVPDFRKAKSWKEILNLPLNCKVMYEFEKLERHLQRVPTSRDVDRNNRLDSSLYILLFGGWSNFEKLYASMKRAQGPISS
jgi:superfamily II DNA or RNA helicase